MEWFSEIALINMKRIRKRVASSMQDVWSEQIQKFCDLRNIRNHKYPRKF